MFIHMELLGEEEVSDLQKQPDCSRILIKTVNMSRLDCHVPPRL